MRTNRCDEIVRLVRLFLTGDAVTCAMSSTSRIETLDLRATSSWP
jgi:hypothetical protein